MASFLPPKHPSICARCLFRLQSRRPPTSTTPTFPLRALHTTPPRCSQTTTTPPPLSSTALKSGRVTLTNRALLLLSGPEAPKFLQGLVTQNIDPTDETGRSLYCGFLNAQGRVGWDAFLYPRGGEGGLEYLIEVDGGRAEGLLKHLKRHKLRSKVKIEALGPEQGNVVVRWGEDLGEGPRDPRLGALGSRELVLGGEGTGSVAASEESLAQYTIHRYLHGIPEGPSEIIPGSALVQESNMDFMDGVDFRKGCYVGQELTIRTQHTGVVRKRILPVMLYHDHPPQALEYKRDAIDSSHASEIAAATRTTPIDIARAGARGRSAGKLLGSVGNVGLALCRLEMMTDLRVSAEGGSWKEGEEFMLKGDEASDLKGLKIKAFVPGWLRKRIEAEWEKKKEKAERSETVT